MTVVLDGSGGGHAQLSENRTIQPPPRAREPPTDPDPGHSPAGGRSPRAPAGGGALRLGSRAQAAGIAEAVGVGVAPPDGDAAFFARTIRVAVTAEPLRVPTTRTIVPTGNCATVAGAAFEP